MEDIKTLTNEKLAEEIVRMKIIIEELQESFDNFKNEFKNRGITETIYLPEYNNKVFISEGKSSSDYNVLNIYGDMVKEGFIEQFPKIVKVNKSQVDMIEDVDKKNKINGILLKNVVVTKGVPFVSVAKMTLKEKKDRGL